VTVVRFARGIGCCRQSVYRLVTAYYLPDGTLIAEMDPCEALASPEADDKRPHPLNAELDRYVNHPDLPGPHPGPPF
jgi:hypothetical protein